jgi:ApbE superfamily uncharacterized protein (UPF0280 family)
LQKHCCLSIPAESAPALAKEMAEASRTAGIGPMASVAGLFAREAAEAIRQNFSVGRIGYRERRRHLCIAQK